MRIGYQGERHSYSHRASSELFAGDESIGFDSFMHVFGAFHDHVVDRLVLPIENSTTGSILPVLDRLAGGDAGRPFHIIAEHLVEVRHALLGLPGSDLADIKEAWSHPEALAQAERSLHGLGIRARPTDDTAGAVRQVARAADPSIGALAPPHAGDAHGLVVLRRDLLDRDHNTTRFIVLAPIDVPSTAGADKTSIVFKTGHTPGALALALTDLGLRGANLTRIESRPAEERWSYRFFVDLLHTPGPEGLAPILEPPPVTCRDLVVLGSYLSVRQRD